MSTYTFKWPKGPEEVIVTGTFDNWGKTLPLVKQADGSFELVVPLPSDFESNRILYKYIVDGEWLVSPSQRITQDDAGIENNVLEKSDLHELEGEGVTASKIPEAGGLLVSQPPAEDVSTTVLPKTEGQGASVAGEPGVFVPQTKEQLAAFATVEDVDSRNLSAAEKKKQKKKVKRSQYKAKKKKKDAAAAAGAETTTESESDARGKSEGPEDSNAEFLPVVGTTEQAKSLDPKEQEKEKETKAAAAAVVGATLLGAAAVGTASSAPAAAGAVGSAAAPAKEVDPVAPVSKDVEPATPAKEEAVAATPITKEQDEPAAIADEAAPVTTGAAAESDEPTPVDPVTKEEPAHPVIAKEATEPIPEKEVDAAPVSKAAPVAATEPKSESKPDAEDSDDEIVIAQGVQGNTTEKIEEAIVAQVGEDVTVEEIKPTASEAARLQKEAHIEKPKPKPTPAPAAKPASTKKEKEKKRGSISRFFKKIFS